MPAPLSLRIKERYMARRAAGLSQQVAADAVGISVRSAQRIDRGDLQPQEQQQRGRHWRTRADRGRPAKWCKTLGSAPA